MPAMDLPRAVARSSGELLLFAVTPPRRSVTPEQAQDIADATLERLQPLDLDALVLYDIDDESDRNGDERPFPFLPTMDPAEFLHGHLGAWPAPVVVYRVVGKYPRSQLGSWLSEQDPARVRSVFVGASSRDKDVLTTLDQACELRSQIRPELPLGGVAIPERHARSAGEHLRLLAKQAVGCSFFITQVIYDVNAAKNVVSDYHQECSARGVAPAPIIFTFTVVGSTKTLEFLGWLGVDVPRWIQNDLRHSADPLTASAEHAYESARDLIAYCRRLGMPFGINVESVSNRRAEIDEAIGLARRLRQHLHR